MTAKFSGETTGMSSVLMLLEFLFSVNIGLAIFNLIPVPPLDGFNILRFFLGSKADRWFYEHQQQMQLGFFALIIVLNFMPEQFNILSIACDFVSDKMLGLVVKIPMHKWGFA